MAYIISHIFLILGNFKEIYLMILSKGKQIMNGCWSLVDNTSV